MVLKEAQTTGLTTPRLDYLCATEQIEYTMYLLFTLNHWAKARTQLFFADRQGLYQIKVALVRHAYTHGSLVARAYIDGKEAFGKNLLFECAADIAAESFLWRLEDLATDCPQHKKEQNYPVYQLYTRITGQLCISKSEVEALETEPVRAYILARLQELERAARVSGQPIPCGKLSELCIAPSDLLTIQGRRYYDLCDWFSWEELDNSDLRKLDPEGLSLVAFDYASSCSAYTFHLPLRLAEEFVPATLLACLKRTPGGSREGGEYFGRSITEQESFQQPVLSILQQLGVNIPAICPHQLVSKSDFFLEQDARRAWIDDGSPELTAGDEGQEIESDACPLCRQAVSPVSSQTRLMHWKQRHSSQDLTFQQARWLLYCSLEKYAFCRQYPPDYRLSHKRNHGTRYWKVGTLRMWIMEEQEEREIMSGKATDEF